MSTNKIHNWHKRTSNSQENNAQFNNNNNKNINNSTAQWVRSSFA